jgi:hypothetical protein
MVVLKYKKETVKTHSHVDIYFKDEYLGYILKGQKVWHFVNDSLIPELNNNYKGYISSISAKTKKALIIKITDILIAL